MLGGWRNQPAGYCIIYKNRQEMDLKGGSAHGNVETEIQELKVQLSSFRISNI